MVCGAVAMEAVSLHDDGGTCFMTESAVPWNDVAAGYLSAVRTGSFIRPGRMNERPNIEYTLYFQRRGSRYGSPLLEWPPGIAGNVSAPSMRSIVAAGSSVLGIKMCSSWSPAAAVVAVAEQPPPSMTRYVQLGMASQWLRSSRFTEASDWVPIQEGNGNDWSMFALSQVCLTRYVLPTCSHSIAEQ